LERTPYEGFNRQDRIAAGTLFFIAVGIRLVGIGYGLPHMYHWDEVFLVTPLKSLIAHGDFLPHSYYYPSGYIYLQVPGALLSYFVCVIRNGPGAAATTTLSDYLLICRSMTAAIGACGVVLVFWFAVRFWRDRVAGVIAALTLAFSPLHVFDSRIYSNDVPMATAAFAAVCLLFLSFERRDWKMLIAAGVAAGVATGFKYNAACFIASAAVVIAFRDRDWRRPCVFILAAVLVFLCLAPGVILERRVFFRDLLLTSNYYFVTGEPRAFSAIPGWHYFGQLWSYGLTPGPLIAAAAGIVLYAYRQRRQALSLLVLPLPYIAFLVINKVSYARNLEPLLPYGAIFAGLAGSWVLENVKRRCARPVAFAIIFVLAGAFFFRLAIVTARDTYLHVITDDRTKAKAWFEETVPWPHRIVKEAVSPLPPVEGGQTDVPPINQDKYEIHVEPYIAAKSAADYASAGIVYIVTPGFKSNLERLCSADPGNAALYNRNYESIIANSDSVLRFEHEPWDFRPSVEVYRLNDDILRASNPPSDDIRFEPDWVRSERPPYRRGNNTPSGFVLESPARGAACFTAPASRFVVEVELKAVSGSPDIAIAIDGFEVARERLDGYGVVRTPPLSAPPYYRHLTVRCPGPRGAKAILISACALTAESTMNGGSHVGSE
jgi:4-amino-4-deoxy-L-arabinose transferase-like glycosyltransferase